MERTVPDVPKACKDVVPAWPRSTENLECGERCGENDNELHRGSPILSDTTAKFLWLVDIPNCTFPRCLYICKKAKGILTIDRQPDLLVYKVIPRQQMRDHRELRATYLWVHPLTGEIHEKARPPHMHPIMAQDTISTTWNHTISDNSKNPLQ